MSILRVTGMFVTTYRSQLERLHFWGIIRLDQHVRLLSLTRNISRPADVDGMSIRQRIRSSYLVERLNGLVTDGRITRTIGARSTIMDDGFVNVNTAMSCHR